MLVENNQAIKSKTPYCAKDDNIASQQAQHWLTAFTQEALDLGAKERAMSLKKKLGNVIDIKNIKIPNKNTHSYVSWDNGKISEVGKDLPPYSSEFGSCIPVLARGIKEGFSQPSHVSLHHVDQEPDRFCKTLENLAKKIEKGTLEIFISGGLGASKRQYENTCDYIEECEEKYKNIKFKIVEDTFRICDLGQPNKVVQGICYPESCGLSYAGFDELQRPFQIVDISRHHHTDSVEKVIWY